MKKTSLVNAYRAAVIDHGWTLDEYQLQGIAHLQQLLDRQTWYQRLARRVAPRSNSSEGVYLWGQPGRGKTVLMDLFMRKCGENGLRTHFHVFMQEVHESLRDLSGAADPLEGVAAQLAKRYKTLCFDELTVHNIGDAMILGRLFECLLNQGVNLVITSNFAPDQLYPNGLHRRRFLPAIELLQSRLQVVHLDGGNDYRMAGEYSLGDYILLDSIGAAEAKLAQVFEKISGSAVLEPDLIQVRGREIQYCANAHGVIWFTFAKLCQGPRAAPDYLDLVRDFHTLILGPVPLLGDADNDAVRRFIHLVDAASNCGVRLIVAAVAPPNQLYTGKDMAFEYQRTSSRLMGTYSL